MTHCVISFYIVYLEHKTEGSLNNAPYNRFQKLEKKISETYSELIE